MNCEQVARITNKYGGYEKTSRVYSKFSLCPTLSCVKGGGQQIKIMEHDKVRKLTPREYWRLMGFTDSDFNKVREVNSDAQLYKQAGNSIVVNVLEEVIKELLL